MVAAEIGQGNEKMLSKIGRGNELRMFAKIQVAKEKVTEIILIKIVTGNDLIIKMAGKVKHLITN